MNKKKEFEEIKKLEGTTEELKLELQRIKHERRIEVEEKIFDMNEKLDNMNKTILNMQKESQMILDVSQKNLDVSSKVYNITSQYLPTLSTEVKNLLTHNKLTWKSPISTAMILSAKLSLVIAKEVVWPVVKFGTFGWWAGPAIFAFKKTIKPAKYVFGMFILIMIGSIVFKVYHNLNPIELGTDPSAFRYASLITRDLINGQIIVPLTNYYNSYDSLYNLISSAPNDMISFITPGNPMNPGSRIISQGIDITTGDLSSEMLKSTTNLYKEYTPGVMQNAINMAWGSLEYLSTQISNIANLASKLNPTSWTPTSWW